MLKLDDISCVLFFQVKFLLNKQMFEYEFG